MTTWSRWVTLLALALACGGEDREGPGETAAGDPNTSLRSIMRGMDTAAARVATGIWTWNHQLVRSGAGAIRDHPAIPTDERDIVQNTLANEFTVFARMDQQVHGLAVELVRLGEQEGEIGEILTTFQQMQAGCVACHRAFRDRLGPLIP